VNHRRSTSAVAAFRVRMPRPGSRLSASRPASVVAAPATAATRLVNPAPLGFPLPRAANPARSQGPPVNILLVEPRTPDTFWSMRDALRFVGKRSAHPPLGLLTVAAMLPADWNCRLVDLNVRALRERDLAWADHVFVSAMLAQSDSLDEVVRRSHAAGKSVVGGGPLFTGAESDRHGVDHVVVGEAEELAPRLVADLQAGRPAPTYTADGFPDLALTPLPRWDLVRLRDYASMAVQWSRGCPFDCEFCDIVALNGRVPRHKSDARFIAELDALDRRGWGGMTFVVDDNFAGNRRRCRDLLRAVIDWRRASGSRMVLMTEASVDIAGDPELLQLMVLAGFKKVFLGIETPSAASLEECRKLQNLRCDLATAVATIQRAGLEVMGGFIVGFDSDEPDIFDRQFEFIQKTGVATAMVGLLQAVPRTRLYQRLAREGRLRGASHGDNTRAAFNFEPRLDRDFLIRNYRQLMRRLYDPGTYYRRIQVFLERSRPRGPRMPHAWSDIEALVKSLWLMGVIHSGRRAYWSFVTRTLLRHPDRFGAAITLAITGFHFRRVSASL